MISYVNSNLYKQDGIYKQINIKYSGGTITNADLHAESFSLEESICSEQVLRFGCCETAKLQFRVRNPFDSLKGENIIVSNILNNDTVNPFQIGKYKVYSDVPSADRSYRDIVAYDAMYDILNADVTEWYDSIFPSEDTTITLKNFRSSFASHFGLNEASTTLVNDSMVVEKTISGENITGKLILSAICEINGCFGNISRDGELRYVHLPNPSTSPYVVSTSMYRGSPTYEDYTVKTISRLHIRQEEGDVGVLVGSGENTYVVEGNFLVYGKEESELTTIANNLFNFIKNITYTPFSVTSIGNSCVEVGDLIRINAKNTTINSYVLTRTLKGIQSLSDLYQSKGSEYYEKNNNNIYSDIQQLKGKSNVLTRDLEETRSTITDLEEETSTNISQTSSSLNAAIKSLEENMQSSDDATNKELEVIRRQLSVTATAEEVQIQFEKERETGSGKVVTSTGYKLDEDGLEISKSDSEMSTKITDDGMTVTRSGEDVLTANSDGVDARNLHAKTYLIIGNTSRFEDYYNSDGELRTGCFWIGDIEEIEVTLTEITVSYTGGSVPVGTSVNSLTGITVRAHYSDGSTANVTGYTLSGTIAQGSNKITVSYGGKTTTFTVTGYVSVTVSSISALYTGGSLPAGTEIEELRNYLLVTAVYSDNSTATVTGYTLSGSINEGTNIITISYGGKTTTITVEGQGEVTYTGITAEYTGGSMPLNTSLATIKKYLTVTASYSDGSTKVVTDYTLAGSVSNVGENEFIAHYNGKGAFFTVIGHKGDGISLGEATTCVVWAWIGSTSYATNIKYSDSVEVVDGVVSLVNAKSSDFYMTTSANYNSNNYDVLLGKYVSAMNGIYYIDAASTHQHNTNVSMFVKENIVYNKAYPVSVAE